MIDENTPLQPQQFSSNSPPRPPSRENNDVDGLRVHFNDGNGGFLPEDDDNEEEEQASFFFSPNGTRTRKNYHRRSTSLIESIVDLKDLMVETIDDFKESFVEGLEEFQEVMVESIEPIKPREEGDHNTKLSALALAVLVFYKVSGGPFGCEPTVRAAGPFVALLGFMIFPILWAIPEALVTAELGSAFPEPSGAIAWVEEAFGSKAGLLCGYFHWVSGATDNAIYPSLFLEYVAAYAHSQAGFNFASNIVRFVFCVVMTIILAFINYTGLEIVGNLSIVVCIISMSPFVFLCILGAPQIDINRWFVLPETDISLDDDALSRAGWFPDPIWMGVLWRPFLNNLFWNLNSFDVGASFAGEVRDPERVFPHAMFLSIVFVAFSYVLPLLVAIGAADTDQRDWNAGYLATLSSEIGGSWLGVWTVFAAAISNIALFEAEMSGDAYQLMGMADRGLIPKVLKKRSRYGTPTNGIIVGTFVIICLSIADFDALVEMLNFAYCLSMILEFSAFVKLRITDDDVERPYKIPLNTFGCVLFVLPPVCISLYLMFIASRVTYIYFAILTFLGLAFHVLQKFAKHNDWWAYEVAPPKKARRAANGVGGMKGESPNNSLQNSLHSDSKHGT